MTQTDEKEWKQMELPESSGQNEDDILSKILRAAYYRKDYETVDWCIQILQLKAGKGDARASLPNPQSPIPNPQSPIPINIII